MKIIQKILSTFLSLTVAASSVVFSTSFAAEKEVNISFNDYATNSAPAFDGIKADNYYIDAYKEDDKALKILTGTKSVSYSVAYSSSDCFVITYDIARGEPVDGTLSLYSGSKSFTLMKFDRGAIQTYIGAPMGGISTSTPTRVSIGIDMINDVCSVYINGKLKADNYYMYRFSLTEIDKVQFDFTSEIESYVLLDNINIHPGLVPRKAYPAADFSDETEELVLKEAAGRKIYCNSDFEFIHDLYWLPGNAEISWHTEDDGNRCMEVNYTSGAKFDLQISVNSDDYPHIVQQMDIKLIDPNTSGLCISTKRTVAGQWSLDANVTNGALICGGKTCAKLSTDSWTNIALVNKFDKKSYDVYIDGELVSASVPFAGTLTAQVDQIRTMVSGGHILIDNYKIYEGSEPVDIGAKPGNPLEYESRVPSDEAYEKIMAGNVGLHLRSGVMYAHGEKNILEEKPFIENDRTMIPVRAVSEAFDIAVDYDDAAKAVNVGDRARFIIGSSEIDIDGKKLTLDAPAKVINGRCFLPLRVLAEEVLGKCVYYDNSTVSGGIIVISDKAFKAPSSPEELQNLNDYLHYVRPSAERILSEYKASPLAMQHPRLMIDKAGVAKLREEVKQSSLKKKWADALIASADKAMDTAVPVYESYDGTRMAHSASAACVTMGMAYLLTGDSKYVDASWKLLYEVCSWMDWNPSHYLDTGETSSDVALAYDWMYDGFTPEQRAHIEEGLFRNGVMRSSYSYHKLTNQSGSIYTGSNWDFVCGSGIYLASVALMDVYPEICSDNISLIIHGLEPGLRGFAPDGGWFEGAGYWNYLMEPFAKLLDTSYQIFGTDYGLISSQGFSDTAEYRLAIQSEVGTYNFADADFSKPSYGTILIYLAELFDKPGLATLALTKSAGANLGIYGLLWLDESRLTDEEPDLPLDSFFEGVQLATMRSGWLDSEASYAGWIGGLECGSSSSHRHLDSGSFVFDVMGERWAMDLGRDLYTLQDYFSPIPQNTFKIFRKRAESHNTIIINPDGTGVDHNLNAYAAVSAVQSKDKGAISTMDLTDTLAPHVNSAKRGLFLTDNRKSLVVRDELNLKKQSEIYWYMYTEASAPEVTDTGVLLEKNGKRLRVDFVSDADFEINFGHAEAMEGMPTMKGENINKGINRIQVKITGSGKINFTAKLSPEGVYVTPVEDYDMPMSQWTIPEGEVKPLPLVDMIEIDGKPLDGFDKYTKSYTVDYVEGAKTLPVFTAQSQLYNVEIDAVSYSQPALIKVIEKDDPTNYSIYTVNFREIPKPVDFNEYVIPKITNVKASHEPQSENAAVNAIDSDVSTRWAAEGRNGVWIELDLGKVCEIDTLLIATMNGNVRSFIFNIETSVDGLSYEKVFDGQTGGATEALEAIRFDKTNARYVKINCFGTTDNNSNWQSINELMPALHK